MTRPAAASGAVKRRPFRLSAQPSPLEFATQKQITDVLRLEIAPPGRVSRRGVVWWSVDAADYGGDVPGARIGRGLIAGCPDLFFVYQGRAFFIEIKRRDLGELSDPQKSVLAALFAASGSIGVATSADDVLALLDAWGVPRSNRTRVSA